MSDRAREGLFSSLGGRVEGARVLDLYAGTGALGIEAMTRTTDGFVLADEDLRLRGEGTLFDTKQSGMPDLKLARLSEDLDLVKRARARAFALIEEDPALERHPLLLDELRDRFEDSIAWLFSA